MEKNEKGFIVLDGYEKLEHYTMGRKEKQWLEIDGKKYLFKSGASNYEIFSELISEEIGKQLGLEMAHYDIATLDGKIGVLTPNFLNGYDIIINGKKVLEMANFMMKENNLGEGKQLSNNVVDILNAIDLVTNKLYIRNMFEELINMWIFDGLVMESDRNSTNWSLIQSKTGFRLSPIYDTSTIAMLNNNIDDLLSDIRLSSVYKYTDNIKNQLTFSSDDNSTEFLKSFANFCHDYDGQATRIIQIISKLNIEEAIQSVEQRIQQGALEPIEIPYSVKYWLNKTIGARYMDMLNIYKYQQQKLKEEEEKNVKRK